VVTDGQLRLADGARVEVVRPAAEKGAEPVGQKPGSAEATTGE